MESAPYYRGMALGDRIRKARLARNLTQGEVAASMGVSRPTETQWENGTHQPETGKMPDLAKVLGVSIDWLMSETDLPMPEPVRAGFIPPPEILGKRDFPVYAATEGGPGIMIVSTDPIDLVPRPWFMGNVKDGYCVLVVGESMLPAYKPGQMAIINPRLAPLRGEDHVLVQETIDGSFNASIKCIVGWTDKEWKLEQYNPPTPEERYFTWPRKSWQKALRVVGKYAGGG